MIPCMDRRRYEKMEEQFYDYFSQISDMFHSPIGFIDFLNNDTGFFDLPASTNDGCNYKGGLLEHSLNVTKTLTDLNYFIVNKKYSLKECILFGLFHDLNLSIIEGLFPFIYMLDDNGGKWIANHEISKKIFTVSRYELMYDYIDKIIFTKDNIMNDMIKFSNMWTNFNEPIVDYNNLEDIELKLPEGYL